MISYLGKLEDSEAVDGVAAAGAAFRGAVSMASSPEVGGRTGLFGCRGGHRGRCDVIESVLDAGERRLIRSEEDVVDGIEYALEKYAAALRGDAGDSAEDLWNTAKGEAPTPKSEEHVSSKLCAAVRAYFREYAVAADREVRDTQTQRCT